LLEDLLPPLESLRSETTEDLLSDETFRWEDAMLLSEDFLFAVKVEKSVYPQSAELSAPLSMLLLRTLSGELDCRLLSGEFEMFLDLEGDTEAEFCRTFFLGSVDGRL